MIYKRCPSIWVPFGSSTREDLTVNVNRRFPKDRFSREVQLRLGNTLSRRRRRMLSLLYFAFVACFLLQEGIIIKSPRIQILPLPVNPRSFVSEFRTGGNWDTACEHQLTLFHSATDGIYKVPAETASHTYGSQNLAKILHTRTLSQNAEGSREPINVRVGLQLSKERSFSSPPSSSS